ncbi:MAG TPA: hypothetical protein VFZ65_20695 [Planctomycetota bacterium]|nr:hypothetical protein [Planctomycetota bacterium]
MTTLLTTVPVCSLTLLCAGLLAAAPAAAQCTTMGTNAYWEAYATGCGTPPVLGATNDPVMGSVCTLRTTNLPATTLIAVTVISFEPPPAMPSNTLGPFTLPTGCWNYLANPLQYVLTVLPPGTADVALPIPLDPTMWLGKVVHAQSAVLTFAIDISEVSNALCLHIGY